MPKPRADESESDYVSRCMGDEEMRNKYPDESQRAAVCHSLYEEGGDSKAHAEYG